LAGLRARLFAVAPDRNVYCCAGWSLDALFLQRLRERARRAARKL